MFVRAIGFGVRVLVGVGGSVGVRMLVHVADVLVLVIGIGMIVRMAVLDAVRVAVALGMLR